MKQVDYILSGGTVVTMNESFDVFRDGAVAILGDEIVAVGERETILRDYSAAEVLDCTGTYITPGLINAHTHVPMTLLRGLADDLRLDVWLMGYIMPTEREFVNPSFVRLGTKIACAEMIRGGVTAFADMYYFEKDIAAATAEVGMRALCGESILKFPSPDAESYEDSLAYIEEYLQEWQGHPLIRPALAPHAPYSNTEETLRRTTELAAKYNAPMMIHVAETQQEQDDNMRDYGQTVVRWMKSLGMLEQRVLAAHCVAVNDSEMRQMSRAGMRVAHCPSANLKLSSGVAPVQLMLDNDIIVGIGTDGPASNNDLDLFEEMRLAALLAKIHRNTPTDLPARAAFLAATRHGAKAIFMDDITGSLEPGKKADVIVVDANTLHNSPKFELNPNAVYSQLVYATKGSDVQHTMVNGRWLMRDRQLLTVDALALMEEAQHFARRVDEFLSAREEDLLSKLAAVSGGLERGESFEIQVKVRLSNTSAVEELLDNEHVKVRRSIHYRQFDTYFLFGEEFVRYREDDTIGGNGEVTSVRSRLTFTENVKERHFHDMIVLSRSRFYSEADRPVRFYREYFQSPREVELHKDRQRWHIDYKGVLFYVNVDQMLKPRTEELYIELKARTWSIKDAEQKADYIREMLAIMELTPADVVRQDYLAITGVME